jgi:Rv2525c-like, glycoside hydrolase-like domain/Hemopexin
MGGKAFFFNGDSYVRYDITADQVDAGYPLKIANQWTGMGAAGYGQGLNAAVNWGNGKAFFFKGDSYVRYDIASDQVDAGYPLKIADQWTGMGAAGFGGGVVAAVVWPSYGVDTNSTVTPAIASALASSSFPGDPSKQVTFVGRYLSKGQASLSPAEVTAIHNAGLKIFSIQQHCNNAAAFFDGPTGTNHATEAIQKARALGQPTGTPIYFAVDYDPYVAWPAQPAPCAAPASAGSSVANVMAYFQAVSAEFAAEGKPYSIGVYGSGKLLTDLQAAGLVDYTGS